MRRALLCGALSVFAVLALVPDAAANKNKTPVEAKSNVLFTDESNFPKQPNLTCRATFTGVDPDTGEPFTIDVEAKVYAKRA